MRLVHDRIFDVEDLKREEGSEEDEEQKSEYKRGKSDSTDAKNENKQSEKESDENSDMGQTFKSRKAFLKYIKESNFAHSKSLVKFKIIGISALLLLFTFGITAYVLTSGYFDTINHGYVMLVYSHKKIALTQSIMNKFLSISKIHYGINPNNTLDFSLLKTDINQELVNLEEVIKFQQNQQADFSYYDKTNLDVIVTFPENTTLIDRPFKMNEALQQIISKALRMVNQNVSEFDFNNSDFKFLNFNLMNNIYLSMGESSSIFKKELANTIEFKEINIMIWLIVGCSFLALRFFLIVPLFRKVSNEPKEILKIFLDIPSFKLRELFAKCETFSNHLQVNLNYL
jgi:hypothetical protein